MKRGLTDLGFDVKFWLVSQTQGILKEPESLSLSLRLGNFSFVVFTVILRKSFIWFWRYTVSHIRDLKIHCFHVQVWVLPIRVLPLTLEKRVHYHYHVWENIVKFCITMWQTCSSTPNTHREKRCILRSLMWDTMCLQNQKEDPQNRDREVSST